MASLRKLEDETVALVDAAKAMLDKVVSIMEIFIDAPSLSFEYTVYPMRLVMMLLRSVGVTAEEMKEFLTKILLYSLPALELSVKAALLTNLKGIISSCSVDPRIPERYRKKSIGYLGDIERSKYGIDIPVQSIDIFGKLDISPLDEGAGKEYYFGTEGMTDTYQLARADDMDAFLWFVKHKSKFPACKTINNMSDLGGIVNPSDATLFSAFSIQFTPDKPSRIINGNTFSYYNADTVSMCVEAKHDENGKIIENTIIPVSDDRTSANWYIRRADQLGRNALSGWMKKNKIDVPRDFSKERAICNIQYLDGDMECSLAENVDNKFRFSILPKPYVHIPKVNFNDKNNSEPPWRFKKLLFNDKGEIDSNGRFTVNDIPTERVDNGYVYFNGVNNSYQLKMNIKSGKLSYGLDTDASVMAKHMIECYPGLTVFEFNYDYVMGMKLFDAKVVATQLINSIMDINVTFRGTISFEDEIRDEVKELIKEIIEEDTSDISDCFFTFDNTRYSALMRAAEVKRAESNKRNGVTGSAYSDIISILNEYDSNASLHEQHEVLSRAFTQASLVLQEGAEDESDKDSLNLNFFSDLVENLVMAIIYCIFSPKVLMLLTVNETIMGGKWKTFTAKEFFRAMGKVIISIIRETVSLLLQELNKFLLEKLEPIIATMVSLIATERITNYTDAMNELIKNCSFIWFKFGNQYLDTKLDTVDYADIDTSVNKENETPNKNC